MINSGNNITGFGVNPVQYYAPRTKGTKTESGFASRFDSVTLSEDRPSSYAVQLTSRLTQEVRASATPGRLSALSAQIASGEYKPDAEAIAKRMLLLSEEL